MEASTPLVIALTSIATGTFTVFLSNFLAPRINAWYERKDREGKVFKKTLRILLEIELYVQKNLKLPSLAYYSESLIPKMKELGYVDDERTLSATLPQVLQMLQPLLVQKLPDKSEALDREFALVLSELSTVDPLLAYRITDRHSISPIQNLESNVVESIKALGIVVKEDDKDIQTLRRILQSEKNTWIDELLTGLRKDILTVAARTGKKGLKEIELYFMELDVKRRKEASRLAEVAAKHIPKKNQDSQEESKS